MLYLPKVQAACLSVTGCYFPGTAEAAESRDPSAADTHGAARVCPTDWRSCDPAGLQDHIRNLNVSRRLKSCCRASAKRRFC